MFHWIVLKISHIAGRGDVRRCSWCLQEPEFIGNCCPVLIKIYKIEKDAILGSATTCMQAADLFA